MRDAVRGVAPANWRKVLPPWPVKVMPPCGMTLVPLLKSTRRPVATGPPTTVTPLVGLKPLSVWPMVTVSTSAAGVDGQRRGRVGEVGDLEVPAGV